MMVLPPNQPPATSIGMTPLHCLVSTSSPSEEMWAVADRLLMQKQQPGAADPVDARATCDVTPLMYAANAKAPDAVAYLLSRGASIDACDTDGDTALVEAIFSNAPACVRVLLAWGADVATVNRYGRGPLHYLAGAGSESVLDVFLEQLGMGMGMGMGMGARRGSLFKLDKYAVDQDGLSIVDIFHRRPDVTVGLREKFQQLLDSIPDQTVTSLEEDAWEDSSSASGVSGDEYFDAEEHLSLQS